MQFLHFRAIYRIFALLSKHIVFVGIIVLFHLFAACFAQLVGDLAEIRIDSAVIVVQMSYSSLYIICLKSKPSNYLQSICLQ